MIQLLPHGGSTQVTVIVARILRVATIVITILEIIAARVMMIAFIVETLTRMVELHLPSDLGYIACSACFFCSAGYTFYKIEDEHSREPG